MISACNPINAQSRNSVSFGGIVRLSGVYLDGVRTFDSKVVNSALRKVKQVLMKQADTPKNTQTLSKMRTAYRYFDRDYSIPAYKQIGDTRAQLAHIENNGQHYLLSGKEAKKMALLGEDFGKAKYEAKKYNPNIDKMTVTELEDLEVSLNKQLEERQMHYDKYIDDIVAQKSFIALKKQYKNLTSSVGAAYQKRELHPEIAVFMYPKKADTSGMYMFLAGNDAYKIDLPKATKFYKELAAKKLAEKEAAKLAKNASKTAKKPTQKLLDTPVKPDNDKPIDLISSAKKTIDEAIAEQRMKSAIKKVRRKKIDDPNQTTFFDKLV